MTTVILEKKIKNVITILKNEFRIENLSLTQLIDEYHALETDLEVLLCKERIEIYKRYLNLLEIIINEIN